MNDYGPMKDSLKRIAKHQGCEVQHLPGYSRTAYMLGINEGGRRRYDVFEIESDKDLNAALNSLHREVNRLGDQQGASQ